MASYNDYYEDPTQFTGYYSDVMGPSAPVASSPAGGSYYADGSMFGFEDKNAEGGLSYDDGSWFGFGTPDGTYDDNSWFGFDYPDDKGFLGSFGQSLANAFKGLGPSAGDAIKSVIMKGDQPNWKNLAALAGGLYGLSQSNQPQEKTGFQGSIPKYEAIREAVPGAYDPARRPGSGGQRYFSDTRFAAPEGVAAAREAAQQEAEGLAAMNRENPTRAAAERGAESTVVNEAAGYAAGGLAMLAKGGAPRYLNGASDGMADKIPARIDGGQEARLSHGEFVIPADVVGHLGNGNSEAGAQRLYNMMDRIRKARTGTTKQGKQINPNKFLPS